MGTNDLYGGIGTALVILSIGGCCYLTNLEDNIAAKTKLQIEQAQAEKAKYEFLTTQAQLQLNSRTNKVSTLEQ
ncbi:MAG: hypothetical protein WCI72_04555 [archaeon]